ncbi:MAG: hemerythrin domain-containing protein [Thermoplasmatota archaeon]|jgi:hemerythrin superfamily protein
MSKTTKILSLMTNDHCKIEGLINDLEKKSKIDFDSMSKSFNKFAWELEKHIFVEEKAIFTSYKPENVTEGFKMLPQLTDQHNFILNTINNWREDIRKKRNLTNIYSLKEFLIKHKSFEEKEVYPKLDQTLSEHEKKHIVAKINEII